MFLGGLKAVKPGNKKGSTYMEPKLSGDWTWKGSESCQYHLFVYAGISSKDGYILACRAGSTMGSDHAFAG